MKKLLWVLAGFAAIGVGGWQLLRSHNPPEVSFARVRQQALVAAIPTNGKTEPLVWQDVRSEIAGVVNEVPAQEGKGVAKDAELAALGDPSLQADIQSGEARVNELKADLQTLQGGGRPAELAEIENSLSRARLDLQQEQRDADALKRLADKQAATAQDAAAAADKVRQTQLEIDGLTKRRASLVAQTDVAAAKARLDAAETALKLAHERASQALIKAPMAGVVYELDARQGEYLAVGAPIAKIGLTDRLRVRVYVDEPELGRVSEGEPVAITWDALPGKTWQGTVEQLPDRIETLGSRQVGEVACVIENPGRELPIGANVNAEIRTAQAPDALVIPKEALRRDPSGDYVLALSGNRLERRPVKTGISNVALAQVTQGLSAGELVALPGDTPQKAGDEVTPRTK
ncbi:MAG TPA: efflux RND transporter periplasmic adaptor subunit [Bryobacteraceae bacterium]|nr:efflux RND transporter periplasmic adaptor subunit [Bryobacteraceae bacterium]